MPTRQVKVNHTYYINIKFSLLRVRYSISLHSLCSYFGISLVLSYIYWPNHWKTSPLAPYQWSLAFACTFRLYCPWFILRSIFVPTRHILPQHLALSVGTTKIFIGKPIISSSPLVFNRPATTQCELVEFGLGVGLCFGLDKSRCFRC